MYYDKIGVTVDIVIFTIKNDDLQVLLVKRKLAPFKDQWAIPGGFVRKEESLDNAARRELEEETGVKDVYLEQLYTFGKPKRDPRGRIVTVAYYSLISSNKQIKPIAKTDVYEAAWHSMYNLPKKLAFDHDHILNYALQRLRYKLEYTTVGFQLLPKKFTLTELQKVYEIILNKKLGDKVAEGDTLYTIFSENTQKLNSAVILAKKLNPIGVTGKFGEKMLVDTIPTKKVSLEKRFILDR